MKKFWTGALIAALLAGSLAGCGSVKVQEGGTAVSDETETSGNVPQEQTEGTEETAVQQDTEETQNNTVYTICVAKLPEQYFITYEIACEDGTIETISKARDQAGNIYYKADEEYLFIKDGSNYILYQPETGAFVPVEDKKYQSGFIDSLTKDFDEYVEKANVNADGAGHYAGESTVAGRTCSIYEISVTVVNFEQKYQFAIDQETYVCLEWNSEKNISGYETAGEGNFACTRFDTEGIDLESDFLQN